MAYETISQSAIESGAFNSVLTFLDTRSLVGDPRDPEDKKTRRFVYDYDPFELSLDFNFMPYLFTHFPIITQSRVSTDGKFKNVSYAQAITIRTAKKGAGNSATDLGRT